MGDLDHFKKLNDTHGHEAGDRALRAFSQTLRATLRGEDLVCRYGGEEFVILFPHRSSNEAAAALSRVQQELLVSVAGGTVAPFTVSFGVARADQDQTLEDVCRAADAALFRAKREGRNRIVIDSFTLPSISNVHHTRPGRRGTRPSFSVRTMRTIITRLGDIRFSLRLLRSHCGRQI
jgi:diguanylate cyclase (GGDEF)-like protein